MKPLSIFERVGMAEAKAGRLERLVLEQARALHALQQQVKRLEGRVNVPGVAGDLMALPAVPGAALAATVKRLTDIAAEVASANLLTVAELRRNTMDRHIVWPRQDAMLAMVEAGFSTTQIGRFFGRDHSTVSTGVRAARARREKQ